MIPVLARNGADIPVLGFGTWDLRGRAGQAATEAALACGYRHLDTAAMYENEAEVGAALRASGVPRGDVFVTTKVGAQSLRRDAFLASAEASAGRLGLVPDLLLVHWPNPAVPLAETLGAMAEARARGLAKHVGVSNFPIALLEEAIECSEAPIVANQCEAHPRLPQRRLREACTRLGVAFVAYCPLGRGDLVTDPAVGAVARAAGRSAAQVVLRWHVQKGVVAIPRSGTRAHIEQNAAIFDFALDDGAMAALDGLARPDGRVVDPGFAPAWDAEPA